MSVMKMLSLYETLQTRNTNLKTV